MALCESFAMSRNTVRAAIRVLSEMGLVSRHPGIGTIVKASTAMPRYMLEAASLSELLSEHRPHRAVLAGHQRRDGRRAVGTVLDCPVNQRWVRFETVRRMRKDRSPVAYAEIYVPPIFRSRSAAGQALHGRPTKHWRLNSARRWPRWCR